MNRIRCATLLVLLTAALAAQASPAARAIGGYTWQGQQPGDPPAADLMQPQALVALLAGPPANRPPIIQIGVETLYRGAHITSSIFAGPASTPEGLAKLEAAVKTLPRDRALVIYCGCCPWDKCPNVRPAYRRLKDLGFTKVQVLKLPENLRADWVERGYPVERSK